MRIGRRALRLTMVALVLGTVGASPGLAGAAEPARVTVSTVQQVNATATGTTAEGEAFFATIDGFTFTSDGAPGTAVVMDVFGPGAVECTTLDSDAELVIEEGLEGATLVGTATGECVDTAQGRGSPYTAVLDITWTSTAAATRTRFPSRPEPGLVCVAVEEARTATVTGTVTWEAPELALSGTAVPDPEGTLRSTTSRCLRVRPGTSAG